MTVSKTIQSILERISTSLPAFIKEADDPGLLTGYCGAALFYYNYYKATGKKKHLEYLKLSITKSTQALAETELIHSHCSGVSGMMWCIQHLINDGVIETNENKNDFKEIDEVLFESMKTQLQAGGYDFLHEGLGILVYFLEKMPDEAVAQYLEEAVYLLEKTSVVDSDGRSWKDLFTEKYKAGTNYDSYNLGLAHGMPAILFILAAIHERGISKQKTLQLIEQGVNWLLRNRIHQNGNGASMFPSVVTFDNKPLGERHSRLGWCYGDLSIGITLWNIGEKVNHNIYKSHALETFIYSATCRNINNSSIMDASLCHGSAGVSHIFRRIYQHTNDTTYLAASQYWLAQTLIMADYNESLFKYFTPDGYQSNYNLLEGLTGIGLSLLSATDLNTKSEWDRCLLIS